MANWKSLDVSVPGSDLLAPTAVIFDTINGVLTAVSTLLSTIQAFLVDLGNPIKPLVDSLLNEVRALTASLTQSGLLLYLDIPDLLRDPECRQHAGGFDGFKARFKASLYDISDANRPQLVAGSASGYLMIVADATTTTEFLSLIANLMRLFGLPQKPLRFPPPTDVNVFPVGSEGDPILGAIQAFNTTPTALAVEWSTPQYEQSPDPGFAGVGTMVSGPLIPPFYLVERTTVGGAEPIPTVVETEFYDDTLHRVKRKSFVKEETGEPFLSFTRYDLVSTSQNIPTFLLGQLGRFRYIDSNIVADRTYHYRVRAVPATLPVQNGSLTFPPTYVDYQTKEIIQKWDVPVGIPSQIVSGRVPTIPPDIDWLTSLKDLFRACFAMGFHLKVLPDATFDSVTGDPTFGTSIAQYGRGLLIMHAGIVGARSPTIPSLPVTQDPITGDFPNLFHHETLIKLQSARLAVNFSTLLIQNSDRMGELKTFLKGPLPIALTSPKGYFVGVNTPETLIQSFVKSTVDFPSVYDAAVYTGYEYAYSDLTIRKNLKAILDRVLPLTAPRGAPPDWTQINVLKDLAPWSGKILTSVEASMKSLSDAYKGVTDEVGDFIGTVQRKVDATSKFLEYLDSILSFIASFSGGFYVLSVPSAGDSIEQWTTLLETAGGSKPSSGTTGYTGGIVVASIGPQTPTVMSALGLLFA